MRLTQSFRLVGEPGIEEIYCSQVDGIDVIFWEDIEQVFPGIRYIKSGNVTISPMRDSNKNRIVPHRIEHFPGEVLNVVLSTSPVCGPVVTSARSHSRTDSRSDDLSPQSKVMESNVEQQLVTSLPSDVQTRVRTSMNVHDALVQVIKEGLVHRPNDQLVVCLQELKDKVDENHVLTCKNNAMTCRIVDLVSENKELTTQVVHLQEILNTKQDELKQLQLQALDQLALVQNSIRALLTQTYELHEYPIPRLFIVLPVDSSSWNPLDLLSNRFRLYFLCECGEHTKCTNSRIPHHIHLAKHEGYDIASPKEFFRQYGSYVLTILRMIKFGISMAGIVVPAVSLLVRDDAFHRATSNLRMLTGNISSGMDQVMRCIESISSTKNMVDGHFATQHENSREGLEGADLRQLETFLKNKDKNRVLGDLYRTVTLEGHVKWVCVDHYRENYQERAAEVFRNTVGTLRGTFDENTGRVDVWLNSRLQAEQFYYALEKAKSIFELHITLMWETTRDDFRRLRDSLAKTNVGILHLGLNFNDGPASDILNRGQRYDPIFDIMGHPSIQSVTIDETPKDFIKRSSLQTRKDDFPNLRYLKIDLEYLRYDEPGLKSLVAKTPNLSRLTFKHDRDDLPQLYNAIAEYQVCPVHFPARSLRILPPTLKQSSSTTPIKDMEDLLQHFGGRIETVMLPKDGPLDSIVAGFARAMESGSVLKELTLGRQDRQLSEQCIKDLAQIVARAELRSLDIHLETEGERVLILESIQWKHLRKLTIRRNSGGLWTNVTRALVSSTTTHEQQQQEQEPSDKIELEEFLLDSGSDLFDNPWMLQDGLLSMFLSTVSPKKLTLGVTLTADQIFQLLRNTSMPRLEELCLWTKQFDTGKVDQLMFDLQSATELRHLSLMRAKISQEQRDRMQTKGVALRNI